MDRLLSDAALYPLPYFFETSFILIRWYGPYGAFSKDILRYLVFVFLYTSAANVYFCLRLIELGFRNRVIFCYVIKE